MSLNPNRYVKTQYRFNIRVKRTNASFIFLVCIYIYIWIESIEILVHTLEALQPAKLCSECYIDHI